jgi:hypothetical protein
MIRTESGIIIASYIAGRFHGSGGGGSPAISISTDGGATLSPPRVVHEFNENDEYNHSGNTALGIARDGAIVLLAMAFRRGEAHTIFGWRSEDEGQTWSAIDTSNLADNQSGSVYGNVLNLPDGRLMVFGHYRSPRPEQGIWVATSDDDGRSWSGPRQVAEAPLVEPSATLSGGRMVALYREQGKQLHSQTWQAVSDDLGESWEIKEDGIVSSDKERFRLPSPFITFDPSKPDQLYSLVTERHFPGNTPGTISLWTAGLHDLKWMKTGLITTLPSDEGNLNRDFGYPWMVPLGNNQWFLLFYFGESAGPCALWSLEIEIAV